MLFMLWIVVPQAASARQCPQLWSTSLASICTAWLCPMSLAVANLKSCSRSTASTVMPSPKLSAKCSAALPMPSNFLLAPPTRITPLQMTINRYVFDSHDTQLFKVLHCECPLSVYRSNVILCCTLSSSLPLFHASITSHTRTDTYPHI